MLRYILVTVQCVDLSLSMACTFRLNNMTGAVLLVRIERQLNLIWSAGHVSMLGHFSTSTTEPLARSMTRNSRHSSGTPFPIQAWNEIFRFFIDLEREQSYPMMGASFWVCSNESHPPS